MIAAVVVSVLFWVIVSGVALCDADGVYRCERMWGCVYHMPFTMNTRTVPYFFT